MAFVIIAHRSSELKGSVLSSTGFISICKIKVKYRGRDDFSTDAAINWGMCIY